ncbi:hypothetical protein LB516_24020 [Mesorhizobium sp. CO1-1-7]|uniref:hypothetical protein n=1 Tax=Mesorhizobium sp. CO1-1-7 TaxID=2876632 RepID=UPI001CD16D06|nr:hypothetical protein [Mesorhizobium sp. CO1-1-7]MBZ9748302.1 hypothetical protein [Mesorhizobium sp. CO1-1-7]
MDFKAFLNLVRRQANTVGDLTAALGQIDIEGAEAAAEALEAERRRILLDGSDKQLSDVEDRIATANRDIERLFAAKDEIERRLEAAKVSASQNERLALHAAAKAQADAAAKALSKEYPEIGRKRPPVVL